MILCACAIAGVVPVLASAAASSLSSGTAPLPPTSLTVTATTTSSITIAWSASPDPSVKRYRYLKNGAIQGAVSALQQTLSGLSCGVTYTLSVESLAAGDTSSAPVTILATTSPCAAAGGTSGSGPVVTPVSTTYYVSPTGSDLNSGTSPATAWQTVTKANAAVNPGDTVVLTGNFTHQAIAPSRSGTATAPITYTSASPGATLDQPGLVSKTPYLAFFGGKSYVTVNGIAFTNSNYVSAPVTNKGVVLKGSNHVTITNCAFTHVQLLIYASDDNAITSNTFRYFVASYLNPATGQPDPNHPTTSGDMINVFGGSDRNLIDHNDMKYAGHSLIEIGSGNGAGDVNAANVISNNTLSNPWYKPLILSDDGAGTIAQGNVISDASTQPTLYSTVPSEGGAINAASAGVQFSGRNFVLRNNTFINNNACYGVINVGSRWYFDANHPNGVLVESLNNQIYNNTLYGNHAAASVSFVLFWSQADVNAKRALPRLTGNSVKNNIFWGNSGTAASWNNSLAYTTLIYHSASMAPPWPIGSYNGNTVVGNDMDSSTAANLNNVAYGTKYTHVLQSLSAFQKTAGVSSNLSINPMLMTTATGSLTPSPATQLAGMGAS